MIINFEVLHKAGLDMDCLGVLIAIKQKDLEYFSQKYLESAVEDWIVTLLQKELIEPMKKKGYKLTRKATALLTYLEIAELTEEIKVAYVGLKELYLANGLTTKLGNTVKGLGYYANFLKETGFDHEQVLSVVEDYLQENSKEPQFIRQLSLLIFKPNNLFSSRFALVDSLLYLLCKEKGL